MTDTGSDHGTTFSADEWIDCSISFGRANVLGIIAPLPFILAAVVAFIIVHPDFTFPVFRHGAIPAAGIMLYAASMLAGIVLHEVIHAVAWVLAGRKSLRSVKFGINWATLSPYAHLKEPLSARAYRIGCVMPAVVLGVLPAIGGIVIGNIFMEAYGLLFILAAGGDLTILWIIRSIERERTVMDHPTRVGCYISKNSEF